MLVWWRPMAIVQTDSIKRRRVHCRSVVQVKFSWFGCGDWIANRHHRGVRRIWNCGRHSCIVACVTWLERTVDIHHATTLWLSLSVVLVGFPSVFVVGSLQLVASWFVFLAVGKQLGLLSKVFQWVVLVLGTPLTRGKTNLMVHTFHKDGRLESSLCRQAAP